MNETGNILLSFYMVWCFKLESLYCSYPCSTSTLGLQMRQRCLYFYIPHKKYLKQYSQLLIYNLFVLTKKCFTSSLSKHAKSFLIWEVFVHVGPPKESIFRPHLLSLFQSSLHIYITNYISSLTDDSKPFQAECLY